MGAGPRVVKAGETVPERSILVDTLRGGLLGVSSEPCPSSDRIDCFSWVRVSGRGQEGDGAVDAEVFERVERVGSLADPPARRDLDRVERPRRLVGELPELGDLGGELSPVVARRVPTLRRLDHAPKGSTGGSPDQEGRVRPLKRARVTLESVPREELALARRGRRTTPS